MSLYDLRRLFALETLDTRFFVPATAPPRDALEEAALSTTKPSPAQNGPSKGKDSRDSSEPPRWKTPEFFLYYLVFIICVPLMFKAVLDVSKGRS
jgi:hypothetical protein